MSLAFSNSLGYLSQIFLYDDIRNLEFKNAQQNNDFRFVLHEPLEVAFKWHQAAFGMGVIDKVENETIDFQNSDVYTFLTPLLGLGFFLLDAIHLYICKANQIRHFVSKDRQFKRYSEFIEDKLEIKIISKYREFYEHLVEEIGPA